MKLKKSVLRVSTRMAMAKTGFAAILSYVIPTILHWPDEFVDDHMKNLLGPEADKTGWTCIFPKCPSVHWFGRNTASSAL